MMLSVGQTWAVFDPPNLDLDGPQTPIDDIYDAFVIDVEMSFERHARFRLNAFEFLYEVLEQVHGLPRHLPWTIGSAEREGMIFSAEPIRGGYRLSIGVFRAVSDETEMSMASITLMMAKLLTDIATSMRAAGIDLERYILKYPPKLS